MPPCAAHLGELDETVRLERPQVVVHLLARQPDACGDPRSRCRSNREFGQQACAHRIECHRRRTRVFDDVEVSHPSQLAFDKTICQGGAPRTARHAAIAACPMLMPPSLVGICWWTSTRQPDSLSTDSTTSVRRTFWNTRR